MEKKDRISRFAAQVLVLLYGVACLWLYYHQSIADLTVQGNIPYQSDLPLHISMVVEDGWYYSFTAYAYQLLYFLFRGNTLGIALLLTIATLSTVYLSEQLFCVMYGGRSKTGLTLLLALSLNLVMPVYVHGIGEFRYVSYQCGNIWHNSTYLCMRAVALATLLEYFKLEQKYREGISRREWVVFALMNVLCTGIKPSFLVAYSPIVGIFLLRDLFRRVPIKNILIFGSALLPSGAVILWQNMVLFGEDTGNGIGFAPWFAFSRHATIPKLAVVCSILFCVIVLLFTWKQLFTDFKYQFLAFMTVIGFAEALCLVENGKRAVDGNFLWGYSFSLFVLFIACLAEWRRGLKSMKTGLPAETGGGRAGKLVIHILPAVIYACHLFCGVQFFVRLVMGEGFWMKM